MASQERQKQDQAVVLACASKVLEEPNEVVSAASSMLDCLESDLGHGILPESRDVFWTTVRDKFADNTASQPLAGRFNTLQPEILQHNKALYDAGRSEVVSVVESLMASMTAYVHNSGLYNVADKPFMPDSGDKRHYVSLQSHCWPSNPDDVTDPKGSWKCDSNEPFPGRFEAAPDFIKLLRLQHFTSQLGLSYFFSQDKAFAQRIVDLLRAFFLNKRTGMLPTLQYAQLRPGDKAGSPAGIMENKNVGAIFDALAMIAPSNLWTPEDEAGLQSWFAQYAHFLESSHASPECNALNNHGLFFDLQYLAVLRYLGRDEDARAYVQSNVKTRLRGLIVGGMLPQDLVHPLSYASVDATMEGLVRLAVQAERLGIDLWRWRAEEQNSILDAWDWMLPHWCDRGKTIWPVTHGEDAPLDVHRPAAVVGAMYNHAELHSPSRDYLSKGQYTLRSRTYAELFHSFRTRKGAETAVDWSNALIPQLAHVYWDDCFITTCPERGVANVDPPTSLPTCFGSDLSPVPALNAIEVPEQDTALQPPPPDVKPDSVPAASGLDTGAGAAEKPLLTSDSYVTLPLDGQDASEESSDPTPGDASGSASKWTPQFVPSEWEKSHEVVFSCVQQSGKSSRSSASASMVHAMVSCLRTHLSGYEFPDRDKLYSSLREIVANSEGGKPARKPRLGTFDRNILMHNKKLYDQGHVETRAAVELLLKSADHLLTRSLEVIPDKPFMPNSGDKRSYVSLYTNCWPANPDNATSYNGPWHCQSKQPFPGRHIVAPDYLKLVRLQLQSLHLALAWHFSGHKVYAERVAESIRAFYLHPKTGMLPNLKYAQFKPGLRVGASAGTIDNRNVDKVFDALALISNSGAWKRRDEEALQQWFAQYVQHLESTHCKAEAQMPDSHGVYFDLQYISVLRYLGRDADAKAYIESNVKARLKGVIVAGMLPQEMVVSRSYASVDFTLEGLVRVAMQAEKLGVDLWRWRADEGNSILDAWDWMLLHWCDRGQMLWPVQQSPDPPLELFRPSGMVGAVYTHATSRPEALTAAGEPRYTHRSQAYALLFHSFRQGYDPQRELDLGVMLVSNLPLVKFDDCFIATCPSREIAEQADPTSYDSGCLMPGSNSLLTLNAVDHLTGVKQRTLPGMMTETTLNLLTATATLAFVLFVALYLAMQRMRGGHVSSFSSAKTA